MTTSDRWRCLLTGCNPPLTEDTAQEHREATGHRVAKWPVRSAEGKRRAKVRNRTGYYDKYNVGAKSFAARGLGGFGGDLVTGEYHREGDDSFTLSPEDMSLDEMSDNDWGVR